MAFTWTNDLSTGSAVIDSEHKELFNAANKLIDACSNGQGRSAIEPTAKFLLDYVNKHFAHEEELQQKNNYPGYAAHKKFHVDYTRQLKQLISSIPQSGPTISDVGSINKHVALLVTHIRTDDKKLGAFLSGK